MIDLFNERHRHSIKYVLIIAVTILFIYNIQNNNNNNQEYYNKQKMRRIPYYSRKFLIFFDFYNKFSLKDTKSATIYGGIITLIFVAFGGMAIRSLILEQEKESHLSTIMINNTPSINLSFDITFHDAPCDIVNVDLVTILGSNQFDIGPEKIKKTRLNKEGKILREYRRLDPPQNSEQYILANNNSEGCNIVGNLWLKQIPGNFHISAHANNEQIKFPRISYAHTINQLYFGDLVHEKFLKQFGFINSFPLNIQQTFQFSSKFIIYIYERHQLRASGLKNWKIQDHDVSSKNKYTDDFKMIKCTLKENEEIKATTYQFTVSKAQKETKRNEMPQAKFQYEFSLMSMYYFSDSYSYLDHYLAIIVIILGGIIGLFAIFDGLLHRFPPFFTTEKEKEIWEEIELQSSGNPIHEFDIIEDNVEDLRFDINRDAVNLNNESYEKLPMRNNKKLVQGSAITKQYIYLL